jgi:nucleotide-binding universal stress UspA family protein
MRILLATDGSEHSEAAARNLIKRPWPAGSLVRVVSVASLPFPLVTPYPGLGTIDYEGLKQSISQQAQALVDREVVSIQKAGLAVETALRHGDPRSEIVQEAEDWKADLIVVGSHGRTGVSRLLLGSVAEYVVRHASCSVEVAREPKRDALR